LGEVERARELVDVATRRATEIGDITTIVDALFYKSYFELWRSDPLATLSVAGAMEVVARERGMVQYLNEAELHSGWARGRTTDPMAGATQVQQALAAFVEQGVKVNLGFYTGLLAQLEVETLGTESALARIDEAFRLSDQVEHRCSVPFLHRLRGEILLKRNPADPAPAEEAFRTSIGIAKEQCARSSVLLASLALAKLLQSTGRSVEAHAVLGPALEGFSPTPEMPQIAEAQALLGVLADTEEVKATEAQRQRRLHLQTAYGQAMMWAKGFSAEETKAAFARVRQLVTSPEVGTGSLLASYGEWVREWTRGDLIAAQELAERLLKESQARGSNLEISTALRAVGATSLFRGELAEARTHLEHAIRSAEAASAGEDRFAWGVDGAVGATAYLALASLAEDVPRACRQSDQALQDALELDHAPTIAHALAFKIVLEACRFDATHTMSAAEQLIALSRDRMEFYTVVSEAFAGWARRELGGELTECREILTAYLKAGTRIGAPLLAGLLAHGEAKTRRFASAAALVDQGLALDAARGERFAEALLYRIRGDILVQSDPTNPAPAEDAYRSAISVAKEQGAVTYHLLAALSLAKLYQSTARPADAHDVLAPALEGFSPTPEMPEIAEAQALFERLAHGGDGAIPAKGPGT
jgi:predicted ATPase